MQGTDRATAMDTLGLPDTTAGHVAFGALVGERKIRVLLRAGAPLTRWDGEDAGVQEYDVYSMDDVRRVRTAATGQLTLMMPDPGGVEEAMRELGKRGGRG